MKITLPEYSLIVLIGASGSGKTTFARKHFGSNEILSVREFGEMVGQPDNQEQNDEDALEAMNFVVDKRMKNRVLTIIDAPHINQVDRKHLRQIAKKYHARLVAIALDLPEEVCLARNQQEPERSVPRSILRHQIENLNKNVHRLQSEGFRYVYHLKSVEEIDAVEIVQRPMRSNYETEEGPFDIIGDVHGCREELEVLLGKLGYEISKAPEGSELYYEVKPPTGRKVVFVGDLVDRGPDSPGVLKLAMSMVKSGVAFCVPGNHDDKLMRKLEGRNVQLKHGLAETMVQLESENDDFLEEVRSFILKLPAHLQLAGGKLVIAHAGLKETMHGRESGGVRSFCLYGETTGEIDSFGLPVRYNWAENYRGDATIVYGHTPIPTPEWLNHTLNIDTGCVFGGHLTALRFPEKELVKVAAEKEYMAPSRPLPLNVHEVNTQQKHDEVLDISYFRDRSLASTRMMYNLSPHDWQVIPVIEWLNTRGVNPRWLIYLPFPATPPKATSLPGLLEHPIQAYEYYRKKGVETLSLQEMVPGNRVVVIITKEEQIATQRFGIKNGGIGTVYTAKGQPYFDSNAEEQRFLLRLRDAVDHAELWTALNSDWICMEADMLPALPQAEPLAKEVFSTTGTIAASSLDRVANAISRARARGVDMENEQLRTSARQTQIQSFNRAWQQLAETGSGSSNIQIAPVHFLAGENKVYTDQSHAWHLAMAEALHNADSDLVYAIRHLQISLDDEEAIREATGWWESITEAGGYGMVVKPYNFIPDPTQELPQPAIWVRGKDALRLKYGPEYDAPEQLEILRRRRLKLKRESSIRELALGYEALHRFVEKRPLNEVHQCIFIQLTLHTHPNDPRM